MRTDRRMNGAARQWRANRRHRTRRFLRGRFLFFRDRSAFGGRRQYGCGVHRCYRYDRLGGRSFVPFLAMRFIVTLARAVVRVRIVHVVGNVLSVILTQLDGYVFID
jgi:hypothetical protein